MEGTGYRVVRFGGIGTDGGSGGGGSIPDGSIGESPIVIRINGVSHKLAMFTEQ